MPIFFANPLRPVRLARPSGDFADSYAAGEVADGAGFHTLPAGAAGAEDAARAGAALYPELGAALAAAAGGAAWDLAAGGSPLGASKLVSERRGYPR